MEDPDIEKLSQELEDAVLQMNEKSENYMQDDNKSRDAAGRRADSREHDAAGGREYDAVGGRNHDAASSRENDAAGGRKRVGAGGREICREHRIDAEREPGLIKPIDGYIAAFLVPVLVMIIIFIQRGIFPFGEESFLRTDMYHQYAPFFSEFQYKLTHGGSLLYSWDVGMGVNFTALYAYYLASPFNWLLILCPKGLIIEFMTYMIVLKTGLSGLAMNYYLRKHYRTDRFLTACFGVLYALSGYMAAYSWNIMWLDCIILFPIIKLGLERLVHEKRWGLYCISLGFSILTNYYISIMICIFMVIDFCALMILKGRQSLKDTLVCVGQFSWASLGAGGFAGIVLIPEILALQMTASGSSTFPKTVTSYFSMIDMVARHIGNVEVEIGLDHWPNIYCGVAVLMFFCLYLACRKISVREKVVYCSLLLFFYLSFSVNVLNFLWHGFHYPNSLPCRQSFIYILLMLSMCCHACLHLEDIPWKHVALALWGAVSFVLIAEKTVTESDFHFIVFYVAILFLALYAGLLWLYHQGKSRTVLALLALGLVSLEAAINMAVTSVTITSRTSYVRDNEDVRTLVGEMIPQNTFYRVEKMTRKTKNDGAWMNFPSVSLFSSVANDDLSKLFRQLGCESSTNAYSITGSTPLINSLFSVRYGLYSEMPSGFPLLNYIGESGSTYLYENKYTLPLGFLLPSELEYEFHPESGIPAEVQNQLTDLLGCRPALTDAWGEVNGQTFRFTPEREGDYYVYVINKNVEEVTVHMADESRSFDHVNRGYFLELGWCPAGQEITVTCSGDAIMDARAYRFDEDSLGEVYERLKNGGMTVTRWQDRRIEGTVSADQAGLFFTSIPYDKGWKVLVDGRETAGRKVMGAFLGFDLAAGAHQISMEYHPPGLGIGASISAVSILCIGLAFLAGRLRELRDDEEDEEYEKYEEYGRYGKSGGYEEYGEYGEYGKHRDAAEYRHGAEDREPDLSGNLFEDKAEQPQNCSSIDAGTSERTLSERKFPERKLTEGKPIERKLPERASEENKLSESRSSESRPSKSRLSESRLSKSRSSESRPSESGLSESKTPNTELLSEDGWLDDDFEMDESWEKWISDYNK